MESSMERMIEILERIEKRQSSQEKKMEEMTEKIKQLQAEKKKKNGNNENIDSSKKMEPMNLTIDGIKSIISYMEPNRRLGLSIHCKSLREIEKSVPMHLELLQILFHEILIDDYKYTFQHEFSRYRKELKKVPLFPPSAESEETPRKLVFDFFAGRTDLRIDFIRLCLDLPFELNIDARSVSVCPGCNGYLKNYLNTVRNADSVHFSELNGVEELRNSMVRNARRLRIDKGNNGWVLEELPNLQAQTILINSQSEDSLLMDLILKWCETRNGKVGFELYVETSQSQQDAVFSSDRLVEAGFFSRTVGEEEEEEEEEARPCLRMDNNSEAVLSVSVYQEMGERYDEFYTSIFNTDSEYLHIKVVPST